ncbi:hypothetical protein LPJ73_004294, partial [Coemansia sp. RSA 2703]
MGVFVVSIAIDDGRRRHVYEQRSDSGADKWRVQDGGHPHFHAVGVTSEAASGTLVLHDGREIPGALGLVPGYTAPVVKQQQKAGVTVCVRVEGAASEAEVWVMQRGRAGVERLRMARGEEGAVFEVLWTVRGNADGEATRVGLQVVAGGTQHAGALGCFVFSVQ